MIKRSLDIVDEALLRRFFQSFWQTGAPRQQVRFLDQMYRYVCQWCRRDDVLFSARWLTQKITTKPPRGVRASLATSSLALPGVTFGNIPFSGKANCKNWPMGRGFRLP